MVAVPFSLGFVVVRFDRTAAPISSVAAESVPPVHSVPSPNTVRVGDVVRLNGHREHRPALFRVRAAAAEGLQRRDSRSRLTSKGPKYRIRERFGTGEENRGRIRVYCEFKAMSLR
jgi:hypothetical protein